MPAKTYDRDDVYQVCSEHMTNLSNIDRLRVLLPHWIHHNAEHAAEFRRWAEKAGDAQEDIHAAADQMDLVNHKLESALEQLGGAMEGEYDHRHE